MKTYTVTITERGQVTLPAEIRRKLGVKLGGQIRFLVEDDEVHVKAPEFTWETVMGSVTPKHRPEDIEAMIREAKDERAERLMQKMHEN